MHIHSLLDIPFLYIHSISPPPPPPPLPIILPIQLSEVVRMRRYNVRFDEESIVQAQGSHSRREEDYENDGEGGPHELERISSSSYR